MNLEQKTCQNCKNQFTIEPEDFQFYEKIKVPPPTFCWQCRFERRAIFRNERRLFRNKSAKSGKEILALYPPDSGMTVYAEPEWWSDDWDAMSYGRDYDFSRTFFEQFFGLSRTVPVYSMNVKGMVNSDYSGNASDLKNCYLLFNSNYSEDCAYSNAIDFSKNCIDNSHCQKSERCYGCFWILNCNRARFCSQCVDSYNLWFCKNCLGCSDCFGCVNLRNKKYHIFNEPYSKEGYERKIAEMNLGSWTGMSIAQKTTREFWLKFPNKYHQGVKNVNCTGAYVTNSKNVRYGYLVREGEDLKYAQYLQVPPNKDCYDISIWGNNNQLAYENSVCGLGTFNVKFCFDCWPEVKNLEYCMSCHTSSDLFGCFGLRNKQYCIFNKQYSKSEYENLCNRIVQHMDDMPYIDKRGRIFKYGEFWPYDLSPYAYNQTIAPEHFPISKERAIQQGFRWQDPESREYETTLNSDDLPDHISAVNDDITKEVIQCHDCKRAYRIIVPELNFLRSEGMPLPRTCVDCRHNVRIAQRNKSVLYKRGCDCAGEKSKSGVYHNSAKHFHDLVACPNEFETSYAPNQPEIVYCEACYNSEVA